ncbi:MAG: hypothetical protein NTX72_03730 [Candidatus Uhrbacteria bacterium]|nr:hypothetical protein [Candidatus Uhrbacteria bacterium]
MTARKTNLALLDQAVESSVAWELGEGEQNVSALTELGVAPKRFRIIGGMRVASNAARDAIIDEDAAKRQERLLRYRADRGLVLERLKRVDIVPVATIPLKAWERICDSAKLYRFVTRGDVVRMSGEFYVKDAEASALKDAEVKQSAFLKKWWSIWGAFTVLTILWGIFASSWFFWGLLPALGIFIWLLSVFFDTDVKAKRDEVLRYVQRSVTNDRGTDRLFQNFWPNYHEPANGTDVQIVLPIPPANVQERLVATERARMPLHVAVVPEAIHFRQNIVDILMGIHDANVEKETKHPDLSRDPIIFVIEGTAVAIIDQYGDFPIEEDIIVEVVNSMHLV